MVRRGESSLLTERGRCPRAQLVGDFSCGVNVVIEKCVPDEVPIFGQMVAPVRTAGLTRDLHLGNSLKGFGIENNLDDPPATLVDQSRVA